MTGQLAYSDLPKLRSTELPLRGIPEDVAREYGVKTECAQTDGTHIRYYFPLYRDNVLSGYQWREAKAPGQGAQTGRIGDTKRVLPFGSHLMGNEGGRFVIVTEAAEGALGVRTLLKQAGKAYRCVATLGVNGWKQNLDWFEKFDTVVIAFDMDDAGREQAKAFAAALSPGKGRVASWDGAKGPDDLLWLGNGAARLMDAINNAKTAQLDGIISFATLEDVILEETEKDSIPYPWACLNTLTYGQRYAEFIIWTGGTKIGKSAFLHENAYHILRTTDDNIGLLRLEENKKRTAWGLMGIHRNLPLGIKQVRMQLPEDERRRLYRKIFGGNRVHAFDHFGSSNADNVVSRIRYMVKALECRWIFLDHLSIIVSGQEDGNGDERKALDRLSTQLVSLTQETGCGIHAACHLKRVGDNGHEAGEEITLAHLRGSGAMAQLAHGVHGLERNLQDPDPILANTTLIRVLANRYSGDHGVAGTVFYDKKTGRLRENVPASIPQIITPEQF